MSAIRAAAAANATSSRVDTADGGSSVVCRQRAYGGEVEQEVSHVVVGQRGVGSSSSATTVTATTESDEQREDGENEGGVAKSKGSSRENRQVLREQRWAAESNIDGRKQLHAREAVICHRARVMQGFTTYKTVVELFHCSNDRRSNLSILPNELTRSIIWFLGSEEVRLFDMMLLHRKKRGEGNTTASSELKRFFIYARKRPMTTEDQSRGEVDAVSVHCKGAGNIVCHDPKVFRSNNKISIRHVAYNFDKVFDETASNEEVSEAVTRPMVKRFLGGQLHHAMLLCYGQTGCGKTYTMAGALEEAVTLIAENGPDSLSMSCLELIGKKAYDLLNARAPCRLLSDGHGKVHIRGARIQHFQGTDAGNADLILDTVRTAIKMRSFVATERNPRSSRSHAVFQFTIGTRQACSEKEEESSRKRGTRAPVDISCNDDDDDDDADEGDSKSNRHDGNSSSIDGFHGDTSRRLTFVDLAGSERNYETTQQGSKLARQGGLINRSLSALKSIMVAYSSISHGKKTIKTKVTLPLARRRQLASHQSSTVTVTSTVQYNFRYSSLTRVLQEIFLSTSSECAIICCVSPTSCDVAHTLNSLSHVSHCQGKQELWNLTTFVSMYEKRSTIYLKPVQDWSADEVRGFMANVEGGRYSHIVLPPGITGKQLLRLNANRLSTLFEAQPVRQARVDREGFAWVEGVDDLIVDEPGTRLSPMHDVGKDLWTAIRRHQNHCYDALLLKR